MPKKIPMRQCIGCRENKEKNNLIRVVRTEDGSVKLDVTGRMNGRGAYICKDMECLMKAKKRNAIYTSLSVRVSDNVYELLFEEMKEFEKK